MSNYFNKTHEEITFEESICEGCGGTWFWTFQHADRYAENDRGEFAIIFCPYCGAKYYHHI